MRVWTKKITKHHWGDRTIKKEDRSHSGGYRKSYAMPEESVSLLPRKINSVYECVGWEVVPERGRIGLGTQSM